MTRRALARPMFPIGERREGEGGQAAELELEFEWMECNLENQTARCCELQSSGTSFSLLQPQFVTRNGFLQGTAFLGQNFRRQSIRLITPRTQRAQDTIVFMLLSPGMPRNAGTFGGIRAIAWIAFR